MTVDDALDAYDELWDDAPLPLAAASVLAAEVRRLRDESKLFRDANEAAEQRIAELRGQVERVEALMHKMRDPEMFKSEHIECGVCFADCIETALCG